MEVSNGSSIHRSFGSPDSIWFDIISIVEFVLRVFTVAWISSILSAKAASDSCNFLLHIPSCFSLHAIPFIFFSVMLRIRQGFSAVTAKSFSTSPNFVGTTAPLGVIQAFTSVTYIAGTQKLYSLSLYISSTNFISFSPPARNGFRLFLAHSSRNLVITCFLLGLVSKYGLWYSSLRVVPVPSGTKWLCNVIKSFAGSFGNSSTFLTLLCIHVQFSVDCALVCVW